MTKEDKIQIANNFNDLFSIDAFQITANLDVDIDKSNLFLERTEKTHSYLNLPAIGMGKILKTITQINGRLAKDINILVIKPLYV